MRVLAEQLGWAVGRPHGRGHLGGSGSAVAVEGRRKFRASSKDVILTMD